MIAVINKLSAQMRLRELQAQGSFDRTLADIYHTSRWSPSSSSRSSS